MTIRAYVTNDNLLNKCTQWNELVCNKLKGWTQDFFSSLQCLDHNNLILFINIIFGRKCGFWQTHWSIELQLFFWWLVQSSRWEQQHKLPRRIMFSHKPWTKSLVESGPGTNGTRVGSVRSQQWRLLYKQTESIWDQSRLVNVYHHIHFRQCS